MPDPDTHKLAPRISNRKAYHDYHILQKLEAGIVLQGSEVKSIRYAQVSLSEGYARIEPDNSLWLYDVDIAPYTQASSANGHERTRRRKLLVHKREIAKLAEFTTAKGHTLVPLSMYFVRGNVKVELGVATGKQAHDKREDLKKKEAEMDMRRGMTRKRI